MRPSPATRYAYATAEDYGLTEQDVEYLEELSERRAQAQSSKKRSYDPYEEL